jgi:hypothetical protein
MTLERGIKRATGAAMALLDVIQRKRSLRIGEARYSPRSARTKRMAAK